MKLTATAASLALAASVAACASAPPPPPKKAPAPTAPKEQPPEPSAGDQLSRAQLEAVLQQGPGRLLANVPIEAAMEKDKFIGWRVQELPVAWKNIELKPGDVIISINAMPLKTPTEFWAAWTTLAVASELKVAYVRDGDARALSVSIVGMPSAALSHQIHEKPSAPGTKGSPKEADELKSPVPANQHWNKQKRKRTVIIRGEEKSLSDTLTDWSD